ncbi:MAG: hypothetical protein PSU94_07185 [Lacunisphaera sp.]|nr:hypothetical protein [Lacunisphaera sp.]
MASVPRRATLLLAGASLATALIASGVALAPHPSLEIFAAPQSGVPAWPGAAAGDDDIRWLGSRGSWDVFALRTAGGNVCVTAFVAGASGGGSCTSLIAFERNGLVLETSSGAGPVASYLTVTWGPFGGAQLDDARR